MIEATYIWVLIAGFGGGVIRGLVGYIKYQFRFKNVGFRLWYFLGMMSLSGIVGLITAIAVKEAGVSFLGIDVITPGLAIIIGYAGGDLIENIYKIVFKKSSIFTDPIKISGGLPE